MSEEYCPVCGSSLENEQSCPLCLAGAGTGDGSDLSPCRSCGALVSSTATVCDLCSADHPTSPAGLAPVAQLTLGFAGLAAVLLVVDLCRLLFGF